MRADNAHHLVAAARRRALDTRARAVRTLRRLDGAAHQSASTLSPARPGSPAPGCTARPTCAPRSPGSAHSRGTDRDVPQARRRFQPANAPRRPHCGAGSRPPTQRSAGCGRRTGSFASSSPGRSGSAEQQAFVLQQWPVGNHRAVLVSDRLAPASATVNPPRRRGGLARRGGRPDQGGAGATAFGHANRPGYTRPLTNSASIGKASPAGPCHGSSAAWTSASNPARAADPAPPIGPASGEPAP
jgi:hypothetical protein